MGTVTIGSTVYTVYGEHAGANSLTEYAAGSLAYDELFTATSERKQMQSLVESTRVFKRLAWTDATHGDPATVGLPQPIIDAAYELALAGLADETLFTGVSTADNTKKLEAKGVSIENFAPVKGGRLPGRVAELVGPYLEGAGTTSVGGSAAFGTGCDSAFDDCDGYDTTGGS
jgi:hypothetical protein